MLVMKAVAVAVSTVLVLSLLPEPATSSSSNNDGGRNVPPRNRRRPNPSSSMGGGPPFHNGGGNSGYNGGSGGGVRGTRESRGRQEEEHDDQSLYFERYGLPRPVPERRQTSTSKLSSRKQHQRQRGLDESHNAGSNGETADNNGDDAGGLDNGDDNTRSSYGDDAASILRRDLLTNYDKGSYPWSYAWGKSNENGEEENGSGSDGGEVMRTGLPIEMGINFHRVFGVDIISSVVDMTVWFRLQWVDPRLAWNTSDYDNLDRTWFFIGDGVGSGETSEIWTPDIELWNLERGLTDSLVDTYASVTSEGVVFWSRPGHLRPVCRFEGLNKFPFDRLTCQMEFGSWAYSGLYLRPTKLNEGFSIGGSDTAGESYNEYSFADNKPVLSTEKVYDPFVGAPEEDWPVLLYNVTIVRSWQPYVRGYITTQVLLNFVGFAAFWLPAPCGERMGLSITALLAAVAAEIVVAGNLPQSSELTWFQFFSLFSLFFSLLSLFECVLVLHFYYRRDASMIPWWFTKGKAIYLENKDRAIRINQRRREAPDVGRREGQTRLTNFGIINVGSKSDLGMDRQRSDEALGQGPNSGADADDDEDTEEVGTAPPAPKQTKRVTFITSLKRGFSKHSSFFSESDENDKRGAFPKDVDCEEGRYGSNDGNSHRKNEEGVQEIQMGNVHGVAERRGTADKDSSQEKNLSFVVDTDDTFVDNGREKYEGCEADDISDPTSISSLNDSSPDKPPGNINQKGRTSDLTSIISSLSGLGHNSDAHSDEIYLELQRRGKGRDSLASSLKQTLKYSTTATTSPGQRTSDFSFNMSNLSFDEDSFDEPPKESFPPNQKKGLPTIPLTRERDGRPDLNRTASMMSTMAFQPRDADDFNGEEEIEYNVQWKRVATRIDDVARFWIPMTYIITLSIIMARATKE